MNRAILTAAATLLLALAACGGDDKSGGDSSDSSDSTAELRPAESARGEEAVAGEQHPFGEAAEVGVLRVTVSDPNVGSDETGPWLEVSVRMENPTDETVSALNFNLICAGSDDEGGTVMGGTLEWAGELPPQTFDEGTVRLLIPGDGRYGEPVPECPAPAVVRGDAVGMFVEEQPFALWAVDDALVAELNAAIPT